MELIMGQEKVSGPIGTLIPIGGHVVHMREDGTSEGQPIVLIHGFLGSMRWFDRMIPLLSGDFRLLRIDLLGHGYSSKPRDGYSPEDQARTIEALLSQLHVSRPIVIGFSLGADVAIALMELGVEVQKLVIVNEGPDYSLASVPAISKILRMPVIGRLLRGILPPSGTRQALEGFLAPGVSLETAFDDPTEAVSQARAVPHGCFVASQEEKERFVAEIPLDERLSNLGVATLAVFGQHDQVYRAEESCERYRKIPNVTAEIIPAAGHSPIAEQPARTAELIRAFIAGSEIISPDS
jgi:pimeloyl-ACP methyl ester carboxylesterase